MADITHNNPLVTESKLTEFYNDIKPFLGCPAYVTQEGDSEYYSTEEKVIGRWVDGKPIYQKIFTGLNFGSEEGSWSNIGINATNNNIAEIVNGFGFKKFSDTDIRIYNFMGLRIYSGNIQYLFSSGTAGSCSSLVLRYTKTTDSALTTAEVSPTHYSTDEQVVGTWIDGKPVYQKVYEVDINSNEGGVNVTIPSVDTLIECKISYKDPRPSIGSVNYYQANTDAIRIYFENGKLNWKCGSTYPYKPIHVVAILRYTKTTD